MKSAIDLIPWKVTDISLRPYKEMWSFNPSIHFDGSLWRCVVRCSDYAMPDGVEIRNSRAKSGESRTKNAMVIFDSDRWRPTQIYKMHEHDGLPRASCESVGYEDIRLFRTDRGGLQGIAASLHLRRPEHRKPLVEQVLLSFDGNYDIVTAHPIRGPWGESPQKNWVPFDRGEDPRFLYSIEDGTLFDESGKNETPVYSSKRAEPVTSRPDERLRKRARERAEEVERDRAKRDRRKSRGETPRDRVDPTQEPLRGGTQLVRVGDDCWLGIGHAMKFLGRRKHYWHTWYTVDPRGKMMSASPPMKLAPEGIEFAAGLAIDGDRVVVSFGVDDMECRVGETRLSAVLETLGPVRR